MLVEALVEDVVNSAALLAGIKKNIAAFVLFYLYIIGDNLCFSLID